MVYWFLRTSYSAEMKKRVNITLEDEVIERIDCFANNHYMSRSGAITMLIVEATGTCSSREKTVISKKKKAKDGQQ